MSHVFLAITPNGLEQSIELAAQTRSAIWCGADAISESTFKTLSDDLQVTRFTYSLQGESDEVIDDAIATVREHHPDSIIWVESPTQS